MQSYRSLRDGKAFDNPTLKKIAEAKGKSVAQILGRWCVQKGFIYIPKSVKKERMLENSQVLDFALTEEEMKELKDEISGHRERLNEMNTDLAENQAGTQEDNQKKMMTFYQKMEDELASFPATKQQEEADIREIQRKTVSILEYISRLEGRSGSLPDARQYAEMQGELKFKQEQMAQAGQTADKMDQELLKVKDEAEKLAGIDQKIETEMSQLENRTSEYLQELAVYNDIQKLEEDCTLKKQTLSKDKLRLEWHLDTLNVQLQQTKANHEESVQFLRSDETHSNLVELTKKLAALRGQEYALNDYVEDKAMQSDYRQAKENVVQMTNDLNRLTQSQVW